MRTISTSAITGTGLKKCMPITLSGRPVTAASEAIGIDDVFEARIACSGSASSARRKMSVFASGSSVAASTIRSAATSSSTGVTRASTSAGSRSAPFSASRVRLFSIVARPRSIAPGNGSWSDTCRPEAAKVWAMPPPICPAPTTRTCSQFTARS